MLLSGGGLFSGTENWYSSICAWAAWNDPGTMIRPGEDLAEMKGKRSFILTAELGKLSKWLRILGFDSVYFRKKSVPDVVIRALRDERVLVSRSLAYLKYKGIERVIIRSDHVEGQIDQVIEELDLSLDGNDFFQRCVECNTPLVSVSREEVKEHVPHYVFRTQELFKKCHSCEKYFWKGTHWDMVKSWLGKTGEKGKGQ